VPTELTDPGIRIILFLCNWGPHAAYNHLQDSGYRIPPEIRMVRIPCTGRISKALLFKAFEMGADGVALVGCGAGSCRYGSGTVSAERNTLDTQNILDLLGLGRERMRLAVFPPDAALELESFLSGFAADIRKLGKSPVVAALRPVGAAPPPMAEAITRRDVYLCQDCGKCTASCPLTLSGKMFSPRKLVNDILHQEPGPSVKQDIHACLTCGICHERCPSDVDFPEFVREVRTWLHLYDPNKSHQPHGGFFQSLMRTLASPDLKPRRWVDLPAEIQVDPRGKILFFGGCSPYFDAFFKHHHPVDTHTALVDSLRLLNFFDVHPRLLPEERCCGHDLLWSGDRENFRRLARLNGEMFQDLGIETIITSCPECCHTLRVEYEKAGLPTHATVTHIYEFLETQIDKGGVTFTPLPHSITYQDSCRMNRMPEVREIPRKLIRRLNCTSFTEMKDSGTSALCCGNCAWSTCDATNKAMQVHRLRQAHDTGSDLLVTSCPKCRIHLRCAMEDPFLGKEIFLETADLTGIIARTIAWE
jgi:Fe-S oxidoreductase/coenzyme F420-reducing hydrogenase delta subunit